MGRKRYISWAEKNGFTTGYNNPVTKNQTTFAERKKINNFPVAYCPECGRCFEIRQSKGNKANGLLKPKYMPDWFPSLDKVRQLCGECVNKEK